MIGWVGNDMKDLSIASHVSVCVFSDRTMANQQLEFVLQASVCVSFLTARWCMQQQP